jgi:hypothetical protein
LLAVVGIVMPFVQRVEGQPVASPKYFVVLIAFVLGAGLLLPSTGERFRKARANCDRARAARAGS